MAEHPGWVVRRLLKERGMLQKELTYQLQINPAITSLFLNGKRPASPALAIKLERILGIKAIQLLYWQAEFNLEAEYEFARSSRNLVKEDNQAVLQSARLSR